MDRFKKTYFSHDVYARQDPKIKRLLAHFRKENDDKARSALCLYWWIIEDMHAEDYEVCNLEAYADDYRCDVEFLKAVLEDFELFRTDDGCYVSDRVIRNFQEQAEKSKKNKEKVEKRWENHRKKQGEAQAELHQEINEELVAQVIQEFNEKFKKSYAVSDDNRKKISAISEKNNLTFEHWQKIIYNAHRGWDFKDKTGTKVKHDKPSLKRILEDWESFLNDDAHLVPDYEAERKAKEAAEQKEAEEKEQAAAERNRQITEQKAAKAAVCDKESAIEYLKNYCCILNLPTAMLHRHSVLKEFSELYDITVGDIVALKGGEA